MKIQKVKQIQYLSPCQWEGVTAEGDKVEIIYNFGELSVLQKGKKIFSEQLSLSFYSQFLSEEKMKLILQNNGIAAER